MPVPYFYTFRLRRAKLALAVAIAVAAVVGGGYARVFAPGEAASGPLAGHRITVDPGHGGIDPGCHRGDTFEKAIVLDIGLLLAETLRDLGADVRITREVDTELSHLTDTESTRHRRDLAARVKLAREHNATLLLSLHVNSAQSSGMGGAMVFYHPGSSEGRRIAEHLLEHLSAVVPGNQNGVLPADYYILRHAPMTAVLVEAGFISNPVDRALLESAEGRRLIADAVARGLVSALAPGAGPVPVPVPSSGDQLLTGDSHPCQGESQ